MGHQSYVLLCTETTLSNPPVVQPKSSCDVHLLRSPWLRLSQKEIRVFLIFFLQFWWFLEICVFWGQSYHNWKTVSFVKKMCVLTPLGPLHPGGASIVERFFFESKQPLCVCIPYLAKWWSSDLLEASTGICWLMSSAVSPFSSRCKALWARSRFWMW